MLLQGLRHSLPELSIKLLNALDLFGPVLSIYLKKLIHGLFADVETGEVKISHMRHETDGCFFRRHFPFNPINHPLDYAEIIPESRPYKFSSSVLLEPVNQKYLRRVGHFLAHVHPVAEVIGHVITAERKHCHGITAHNANLPGSCGRCLRTKRRCFEHAVLPVEALTNEGYRVRPPSAKQDTRNGHAVWVIKLFG